MSEIEDMVKKYLERKPDDWFFFLGSRKVTKKEALKMFNGDKEFKNMVMQAIVSLAVDLLSKE
jgi:restriction endonuclease S subunit